MILKKKARHSRGDFETSIGNVFKIFSILFFLFITIFPFYWMLNLSFRPYGDVSLNPSRMVPRWSDIKTVFTPFSCLVDLETETCRQAISNSSYSAVLINYNFLGFIKNSLIISSVTVILNLIIAVPAAYATTRLDFRGRNLMNWIILLIYMFPSIVISIPLFVFFVRLQNLLGIQLRSPMGVAVIYLAGTLPLCLHMLRGYFESIPKELEEAARIDGASRLEVILKITIPLAAPVIATVALYIFMVAWNEFLYALLFLVDNPDGWTLPLGLQQLDNQEVPSTFLMAGSAIISIPIIILYFFLQRFLKAGLTAGGVEE
ncbi:carbohydrate ABC transporter permease [bacterium]|nr:carbohydrate ABC transporter permease [bacterium]